MVDNVMRYRINLGGEDKEIENRLIVSCETINRPRNLATQLAFFSFPRSGVGTHVAPLCGACQTGCGACQFGTQSVRMPVPTPERGNEKFPPK